MDNGDAIWGHILALVRMHDCLIVKLLETIRQSSSQYIHETPSLYRIGGLPSRVTVTNCSLFWDSVYFFDCQYDRKVYWQDETASLITGCRLMPVLIPPRQVFNGQVISVEELIVSTLILKQFLRDTVSGKTFEHSPLLLNEDFGRNGLSTSVAAMRSQFVPWLAQYFLVSLAMSRIIWITICGMTGVALIAVSRQCMSSPREAREYSLWMLTIVLSSAHCWELHG